MHEDIGCKKQGRYNKEGYDSPEHVQEYLGQYTHGRGTSKRADHDEPREGMGMPGCSSRFWKFVSAAGMTGRSRTPQEAERWSGRSRSGRSWSRSSSSRRWRWPASWRPSPTRRPTARSWPSARWRPSGSGRELTRPPWRRPCSGRPNRPKKRGSRASMPLRRPPRVKDRAARTTVTSAGRVELVRRSMRCPACGATAYPADDRVGLDGFLSPRRRPVGLPGRSDRSFASPPTAWRSGRHPARRRDNPPVRATTPTPTWPAAATPPRRRRPSPPPRGRSNS